MHFESFAQIAERLNRTLVLTHVGHSRIQACKQHPFDFYYDVDQFRRRFPGLRIITQSDFRRWTVDRRRKPETYWGFIQPRNTSFLVQYLEPYDETLKKKECLWQFEFVFDHNTIFKKIFLGVNFLWTHSELDEAVTKFMLQQLTTNKEVLLLEHRLPKLLFNDPRRFSPIPYTKQLVESTTNASNSIRPYVGIHWRMEQGDIKRMPKCANQLIGYLKRLKKRIGIENVYLATDYPIREREKGAKKQYAQSATFHKLFPEHHKAYKMLTDYLGKNDHLHTWISTDLLGYLPKDGDFADELRGSGIQGIADKLMLGKLNSLIGKSSGYVENLPKDVRRRIHGLKSYQAEHAKLEAKFQQEILALEKKYLELYRPLYEKRSNIVRGESEPSEEDIEIIEGPVKGIPEFWLTAMKNLVTIAEIITERDEEAMKHLIDIRMSYLEKPGFRLEFEFEENRFFKNKTLTKTYFYQEEPGYGGDFVYDHAEGTQIEWKENQNLTVTVETKKQRHKGTKNTRVVRTTIPAESFFQFFNPPTDQDEIEDEDDSLDERLEMDYQIGEDIKEKLIPRAVDWYTGKALNIAKSCGYKKHHIVSITHPEIY
ncbi:148_t:CDS:2 [Acaulospora colombiana]|uniref:148_t:CDS:1 n=1 Tax=Acaulospora colombiana TaxID=27376 RepID=A0ACA9KIP2_9GLOM|nr:148_t:CDS:2 [Acaulospora colombiana]